MSDIKKAFTMNMHNRNVVIFEPCADFIDHFVQAAEKIVMIRSAGHVIQKIGYPPVVGAGTLFTGNRQPQATATADHRSLYCILEDANAVKTHRRWNLGAREKVGKKRGYPGPGSNKYKRSAIFVGTRPKPAEWRACFDAITRRAGCEVRAYLAVIHPPNHESQFIFINAGCETVGTRAVSVLSEQGHTVPGDKTQTLSFKADFEYSVAVPTNAHNC